MLFRSVSQSRYEGTRTGRHCIPSDHPIHEFKKQVRERFRESLPPSMEKQYFPLANPVMVTIFACFKAPKAKQKLSGFDCTKRPDVDNLGKAILDALNGVAWIDDSQVTRLYIGKCWGNDACTEVEIKIL